MKAKSAKAKGKKLEQWTASQLRHHGIEARVMPGSGAFTHFKSDIYAPIPYSFECKNQETTKVWEWYEQSRSDAGMNKKPVYRNCDECGKPIFIVITGGGKIIALDRTVNAFHLEELPDVTENRPGHGQLDPLGYIDHSVICNNQMKKEGSKSNQDKR